MSLYESIYVDEKGIVSVDGVTAYSQDLVYLPYDVRDGPKRFFSEGDMDLAFSRPLKFGDKNQALALKAYQVFTIQKELNTFDFSILRSPPS